MFIVLSCVLTTPSRRCKGYLLGRSSSFTTAACITKKADVAGQFFRHVLLLVLQPISLHLAQPFGESCSYRLKVSGWIVGPNHNKGVGSGGNNGVAVETLEALPRHLAPFDDDVQAQWPAVGLRNHLWVDVVEH